MTDFWNLNKNFMKNMALRISLGTILHNDLKCDILFLIKAKL